MADSMNDKQIPDDVAHFLYVMSVDPFVCEWQRHNAETLLDKYAPDFDDEEYIKQYQAGDA